ncbi:uncharacterized protein LOC111679016 [Lucilia cuprina]|uniref:uncharacterized protein LOC111679016 n=1 Tax=Lucilia cuprina TaxID=7375 RepID=UPI001F05B2B7|nr:uncharacterized protein LOC111679016 [Lucilia cuprina]XP_046811748.1 uncharacterized protein LOC111679016 [Lucilia cuprina]
MEFSLQEMDDLDLKNLLEEWNLSQHYEHFIEQKVFLNVLGILKSHHIDKLFANLPIGDQVRFEYKLELWKQNQLFSFKPHNKDSPLNSKTTQSKDHNKEKSHNVQRTEETEFRTTAVIVPQLSVAPSIQLPSSTPRKSMDHNKSAASSSHSTTTKPITASPIFMSTGLAKQPAMAMMPVRYNLRTILEETSGGQMIMNYYEKHKILREEHRTALINVIARYIDANGGILSLAESNQLERQIVELFPTEKEEFYRTNRRGRIYNKVANMKRVYKKFSMAPEEIPRASIENSSTSAYSSASSPVEIIKEEDSDEYDDYTISEFRSSNHTPEEYNEFWKSTQKMRLKHIEDIESLAQILEKWPEYKQHNAVEFINVDFKAKYPDATSFAEIFHENKSKLEKLLYSKVAVCSAGYKYLQQYQKCSYESQNLIILWVMHQLFPPSQKVVVDEMGNKRKKRYSIQYSQNAFVCIRSSLDSLESALETQFSSATPPMILIVGELAGDIDQIFVYFEGVRFPMDSVIAAAQLVCELFFLFDLDYPEEAVLYYYFVQTYFLNIEPEIKNTKIYTVINEINAC